MQIQVLHEEGDFNSRIVTPGVLCVDFRERPVLLIFGGHEAVVRPVPIPNTAVKHSVADGSACIACARVGSRQFFIQEAGRKSGFLFFEMHLQGDHPFECLSDRGQRCRSPNDLIR
jgi:hypothetical protein